MTERSLPGRVFRAPSAYIAGVLAVALAVFLLGDAWLRAGLDDMLLLAPWVLAGLWAIYVLFFAPHIRFDDEGVRLHNVLRVVDIPWARISDIAQRWQIDVIVDDGRVFHAFGGPATSRPGRGSRRAPRGDEAVDVLRDAWEARRGTATADAQVRLTRDAVSLISGAVIVVWAIAAILITH